LPSSLAFFFSLRTPRCIIILPRRSCFLIAEAILFDRSASVLAPLPFRLIICGFLFLFFFFCFFFFFFFFSTRLSSEHERAGGYAVAMFGGNSQIQGRVSAVLVFLLFLLSFVPSDVYVHNGVLFYLVTPGTVRLWCFTYFLAFSPSAAHSSVRQAPPPS